MSKLERNISKRKGGETKSAITRRILERESGKATLHEMAAMVCKEAQIECKYLARRYVQRYAEQEGSGIKVLSKGEAAELRSQAQ
jgi:hypothetical protein